MNRHIKRFRPREEGAALIIVLAFVVLLTGLAVAYLARTTTDRAVAHSSFNQSNADQLAESAADTVIADFRQEIVNGSTATTVGLSTIYTPKIVGTRTSSQNMLPVRNAPGTILNLIRRSAQDDGVSGANAVIPPGLSSRASAVNSGPVNSANPQRGEITFARWNKHYLIPTGANPPTPISDFVAPDWVIVTRGGPTVFNTWNAALADATPNNDTYAIGRYAYAVYDEGGLLDANVAGYPPTATTAAQYGPKGVSAFADLTALGMSNGSIDGLVGWRNYASAQPNGNFPNFTFNGTSATRYVNFVLSNTTGFIAAGTNTTGGGPNARTDQAFVNRQSLLQFCASNGFTPDALQYLGTFSRELNAPSWTPTQDASALGGSNGTGNPPPYAYQSNADSGTAINRNLLGVRVVNSFIRADGTTAAVGDPLINRRFPLTRLAGVGSTGLNATGNSTIINGVLSPASAATIQRDFGLVWNTPTQNDWNYIGASITNPPTVQPRILTLDEVANGRVLDATGAYTNTPVYREPNFFELLKAAILSGSVGLGSGTGNKPTFVAAEGKYYDTTNNLSSDYQIMQIGACIINQWDSGNVPIFFNFGGNELAGIKNLPYLNKLVFKPVWKKVSGKDQFAAWLLPSLWNPHQNAPAPLAQNVQIAMTSGTMTAYITYTGGTAPYVSSASIVGDSIPTQFMTVDASSNWLGTSPSAPTSVKDKKLPSSISQSTDGYYGFYFPFATNTLVTPSNSSTAYPDFGLTGCNFEMQVQVGTTWKAYQRWVGCGPNHPLVCQSPPSWTAATIQDPEFVVLDPRTLRFGVWGNDGNTAKSVDGTTDYTNGTQVTLDWPPTEVVTAEAPQGTTWFSLSTAPYRLYLYANNADPNVHYIDLDQVQRQGDVTSVAGADEMQQARSSDRPLMLSGAFQNGVFQSVAELGHVFRDQPWKTLNFTSANSGDAGLLDVFTLHESSMEAGKTSLNTRQPLVLKAILSNALQRLNDSTTAISPTQRDAIITALTSTQPMVNKTELVTRLAADSSVTGLGTKEPRECVMRAFSDACQTRTWNLLIDVIAQSGRYPPNASTLAGFLVEGEQHYWVHVAIDRFTGQVIDKQIEVVNE